VALRPASVTMQQPERFSGVVHVFSRMDPGGAELRTISVLEQTELTFDFLAMSGSGTLDLALEGDGHRVFTASMSIGGLVRAARVIGRNHYVVVHSHLGPASGPILFVAALLGVPVRVAHFRSDGVGGRKSILRSLRLVVSRALVALCATKIIGVSPGALSRGWRRGWAKDPRCSVIPNGMDARLLRERARGGIARRPDMEDRFVVANIGRAEPSKNRARAIRIWAELASARTSTLVLVGPMNELDRPHIDAARARILPSSEIVETGESTDVPGHLGMAHVLLVTSLREGLPGVVLESLAVGVPVVSSRLPGTTWIAEQLEGIAVCGLEEDDEVWVRALEEVVVSADSHAIRASFDSGPFTLEGAVPAFAALWKLDEVGGRR